MHSHTTAVVLTPDQHGSPAAGQDTLRFDRVRKNVWPDMGRGRNQLGRGNFISKRLLEASGNVEALVGE